MIKVEELKIYWANKMENKNKNNFSNQGVKLIFLPYSF